MTFGRIRLSQEALDRAGTIVAVATTTAKAADVVERKSLAGEIFIAENQNHHPYMHLAT